MLNIKSLTIKYIFLSVFIVAVLMFVYIDKLLLFGALYLEKHKYSRDNYAFMYMVPGDVSRYLSDSHCLNDENKSWESVRYKNLNMLVPSYGQYDRDKNVGSHVVSINYDDGTLSAFTSSIDKSIFDPNTKEGNDYSEIIQHFEEYTKLDVLEYILASSPDDLLIINSPFLLSLKVIALEIKRGMVPNDVTDIEKIFINKDFSGIVVKILHESSRINIAYIYNNKSDYMYQINFLNMSDEKVNCVLETIK